MRKFNLIVLTALSTMLLLVSPTSVLAAEDTTPNLSNMPVINIMHEGTVDGVVIEEINREQHISNMAQLEGITYADAEEIVDFQESLTLENTFGKMSAISPMASSEVIFRQASWNQTYPGNSSYSATLLGSFEVYVSSTSSFREIISISVGSTRRSGLYSTSWLQANSWKTTQLPATQVTLGVTGTFSTTVSNSTGLSCGIPGLSLSNSTSTSKIYISSPMTIQRTYSVY